MTDAALDEYGVRGALLLGESTACVWDTLARPRDMAAWAPLLARREAIVVYSHADWDHVWGTAGLPSRPDRIVAHANAAARFASDVPSVLAAKRAAEPGRWDDVVLVPPTETFEADRVLRLGGMTVELHRLPGHTTDSIVGFIPERGILLAGDTVETPCPVVPADSPLADWIAQLRRWASDDRVGLVVPAHGPVGDRNLLHRNIRYLESILEGSPVEPAGPLAGFYRETHAQNSRWAPAPAG